jgi:hypothetical protein
MSIADEISGTGCHWPDDPLFWSKVERARKATLGQKFVDGFELFDASTVWMKAGIQHQFPDYSHEEHHREFLRRLQIARDLDDAGIYILVSDPDE